MSLERLPPEDAIRREQEFDRTLQTAGHYDMDARHDDMDAEGIAADVIFHSSQNNEPIPFIRGGSAFYEPDDRAPLVAIGLHVFNAWLADACSLCPERHVGLVHLPAWDVDNCVREVEWARGAGLRGVNFPTPRPGVPEYDDPQWERFWSACEDLDMTLNTHVGGAGGATRYAGPHAAAMMRVDQSGWLSRRGLPRLLFGGVFERHPGLRLVLTEQNGEWWAATMREYDSAYLTHRWQLAEQMPKLPSEYCATNVSIGASYMAPFEAEMAVRDGYVVNVMWGADYPHAEGTYQYPTGPEDPSYTHLSLRHCFAGIHSDHVKLMISDNALRCYGFDVDALREVAGRIASPTLEELATPVDAVPQGLMSGGFRTVGPWG
jgi:predicted TIM-barrel fold metal-dependent hydrolase